MRLERSRSAAIDLDEILTYGIAQFGEAAGTEYYFSCDAVFAMLKDHPLAGAMARDVGQRMDVSAAFDA